ncbi:polysaccharide export protein [Rhizorhabdus wittichii]|uniref:Polysaccharide export protein n=1 Tax=Rhizorhabdus wittichii TaxID=160791 RepID=A0A975D6G3_9SPHN|nr:polysaccharide biosynthesis/export family protein [Rhizorhabdus wittichii]QTH23649.1 polysaccharide export protein [Rhizorhabdus wittichii]
MTAFVTFSFRRAASLALALLLVLGLGLAHPAIAQEAQAPTPQGSAASVPLGTTLAPGYVLGTGDKLRISVFGEPKLDGEYVVSSTGIVSFPLIGNVPASGQTVEALQESIRSKLAAGYLKDPRVSAEVLNYRPFYILGEINKPGEYPFVNGITVQQAVAMAGGFSYRANTKRVFIKRALETAERPVQIKGKAVLLMPGDTIRVGERFF